MKSNLRALPKQAERLICLMALLPFLLTSSQTEARAAMEDETSQTGVPSTSRKAAGFIPKGWRLVSSAQGDLNKDGRKDLALIISDQDDSKRQLLIALSEPDKLLHKCLESKKAVAGADSAALVPQVAIKNGVLIVKDHCGSRQRTRTDHKYQFRNGQWYLIGFTRDCLNADAQTLGQKVDVNLLTGNVEGKMLDGNKVARADFLEIRSPLIKSPEPEVTDWTAPATWLNAKTKACPIVSVQSVHSDDTLFVRIQLQGSYKINEREIRLEAARNQALEPAWIRKTAYGYLIAAYDLKKEPLLSIVAEATRIAEQSEPLLRISVEVTPKECGCTRTYTTARSGLGGILLTRSTTLPRLADIDALSESSSDHPFLWKSVER